MMAIPCNSCKRPFTPRCGLRDYLCPACVEKRKRARIERYNKVRRERNLERRWASCMVVESFGDRCDRVSLLFADADRKKKGEGL